MIVRTEFIQLGDQADHLSRVDTNKRVVVRHDLARLAVDELSLAIRVFAAIARTNTKTRRDLVHTKISPSHVLTNEELTKVLDEIEAEYRIPKSTPRLVVEHHKGDRPPHYHVLWPIVDPASGRAIKSNNNYFLDELVSRRLELAFGETLTPGPRQAEVIAELRHRGESQEADALSAKKPVAAGARVDGRSRQQAERLGVDLAKFMRRVDGCWVESAADNARFRAGLAKAGMRVAKGDNAIMVLDDRTGYHAPLARVLRQVGKANARPIDIKERDLATSFATAPLLEAAREAGFVAALERVNTRVDLEFTRLAAEAALDGEVDLAARLKTARSKVREKQRAQLRTTLKARRKEIADAYRRRDRIRRARVARAFRAAKWAADPVVKKFAFLAAAGAVAMAGGGLAVALVAGGVAVGMLPSFERARMLAALARHDEARDGDARQAEFDAAYRAALAEAGDRSAQLDFATIKKQLRGLAGFIGQCAIRATEAPLDQAVLHRLAAAEQTIGLEMAQRIRCAMFDGPPGGALRILSWYKWNDPRSENALVGATLPHQANSPSSNDTNVGRAAPSVVRRPTKRGSRKTVERD